MSRRACRCIFIPYSRRGEERNCSLFFNIYQSLTLKYILQAFVGVAKDLDAIVIAFRGTQESRLESVVIFLSFICFIVFQRQILKFFMSWQVDRILLCINMLWSKNAFWSWHITIFVVHIARFKPVAWNERR